jgi:hypothetical protein
MWRQRTMGVLCLLPLAALSAEARSPKRTGIHTRSSSIANRRRLNVNSLITEPGTAETEWYGVIWMDGDFSVPTTWKVTPGSEGGFWARTELSASFDAAAGHGIGTDYVVQSTDHLTFNSTTVVGGIGAMQFAVAPTATFWLRDESGARLGAIVYGKAEGDRHQGGFSLAWTGATSPSPTNPAGTFDASAAYGYRLGKFTLHASATWERSTGVRWLANLSEGVGYDVSEKLSFDVSGQQINFHTGTVYNQVILGMTWNLGRIRKH